MVFQHILLHVLHLVPFFLLFFKSNGPNGTKLQQYFPEKYDADIPVQYPFCTMDTSQGVPIICLNEPGDANACISKNINYTDKTLTLVDPNVADNSFCPSPGYNLAGDGSLPSESSMQNLNCGFDLVHGLFIPCSSFDENSSGGMLCLCNDGYISYDLSRNFLSSLTHIVPNITIFVTANFLTGNNYTPNSSTGITPTTNESRPGSTTFPILCHIVPPNPGGTTKRTLLIVVPTVTLPIVMLIAILYFRVWNLVVRRLRRLPNKNQHKVYAFMKQFESIGPKRYSYSDIREMTNSFADKLGQGGFGSVYKGKLPDGRAVAVKVLDRADEKGDDFINEVGSISRTSHVNVITLLGFCYHGKRRALVFEFMPNGSLDRFLSPDLDSCLDWNTLFKIATGSAHGLEYLHRGCNTRIVHFDIKPHNILLDDNFSPKISDFGLAKFSVTRESILSKCSARGTIGYIAPEVFFRQFGVVSHKSDVYSYGMMILEMVGVRTNPGVQVDRSSRNYFPQWIYDHLELGSDLNIQAVHDEEEEEIYRKLIMVGLWCIQTSPSDRPAMDKVVEMLEGRLEALQMPPKPLLHSPPNPTQQSSHMSTE